MIIKVVPNLNDSVILQSFFFCLVLSSGGRIGSNSSRVAYRFPSAQTGFIELRILSDPEWLMKDTSTPEHHPCGFRLSAQNSQEQGPQATTQNGPGTQPDQVLLILIQPLCKEKGT